MTKRSRNRPLQMIVGYFYRGNLLMETLACGHTIASYPQPHPDYDEDDVHQPVRRRCRDCPVTIEECLFQRKRRTKTP